VGEQKPRILGDSFGRASTSQKWPTPPPAISAPVSSVTRDMFVVPKYIPYSGNGSTSAMGTANLFYFVPLLPLEADFLLHFGRIRITTGSASEMARMAFYEFSGGVLTKVDASELAMPTDTGSVAVTKAASFTLSKEKQYFWVSGCTSITPTFSVFNMSDSSPRVTPFYTLSLPNMVTGPLPETVTMAQLAAGINYTTNAIVAIAATYYSKNMLPYV
jgi:hypothetical protein